MNIKDILRFIFDELKRAVERNDKERISDLAITTELLHEMSIKYDQKQAFEILKAIDYIVNHYDEEPQYLGKFYVAIEESLEKLD